MADGDSPVLLFDDAREGHIRTHLRGPVGFAIFAMVLLVLAYGFLFASAPSLRFLDEDRFMVTYYWLFALLSITMFVFPILAYQIGNPSGSYGFAVALLVLALYIAAFCIVSLVQWFNCGDHFYCGHTIIPDTADFGFLFVAWGALGLFIAYLLAAGASFAIASRYDNTRKEFFVRYGSLQPMRSPIGGMMKTTASAGPVGNYGMYQRRTGVHDPERADKAFVDGHRSTDLQLLPDEDNDHKFE